MRQDRFDTFTRVADDDQIIEPVGYDFGLTRRAFVQFVGTGILIATVTSDAAAQPQPQQRRGGRGGASAPADLSQRLHIGADGIITIMTGKVEAGQGSRAQITQAAAEELRIDPARVRLTMADTANVPDDGITAGSRTTPSTLPAVRQACAAAHGLLVAVAAEMWQVDPQRIDVRDGAAIERDGSRRLAYSDLANDPDAAERLRRRAEGPAALTPTTEWKTLGTSLPRPNGAEIVTGAHAFPSDVIRAGMLYGKVLRPPSYGAELREIDPSPAKAVGDGIVVVRDGNFAAVAAPSTYLVQQALVALENTARWQLRPHPPSRELFQHLRRTVPGGVPDNPFAADVRRAAKSLKATYTTAYIQHAPLEPRAAVAEWDGNHLTVWTATQNPFGVRRELASAFHIPEGRVRVIVPDFGGGFGGKHTGETAVEAARLAQAARKPVAVRWTRAEEFTWAVFRPAALIDLEASLDDSGTITTWHFVNINSGRAAVQTPYRIANAESTFVQADAPLRHGSYRALAATANNFARECFMDELAAAAGRDPLLFRLDHLDDARLRAVLEDAAERFGFVERFENQTGAIGVGIACGVEKGSYVAACAQVEVDRDTGAIHVRQITQSYECGAITNPRNLRAQVEGCVVMGLGGALREVIEFEEGRITNASFWKYEVPRLADLPQLDIHLLDRRDLPSAGGSETPIICVAPAIANAVYHATGERVRQMPIRLDAATLPR